MAKLLSGLPEEIADEEDLARFLTSSNQFNKIIVKPSAFLPNPHGRETSVSHHGREPSKTLWEIGIAAAGERTLHGAAIFKASAVRSVKLQVFADEPPLRHAAIRNWPWIESDIELQKAQQKQIANDLASVAGEPYLMK